MIAPVSLVGRTPEREYEGQWWESNLRRLIIFVTLVTRHCAMPVSVGPHHYVKKRGKSLLVWEAVVVDTEKLVSFRV